MAEREGFAVLYPQGLKDPKGHPGFNVGYPNQKDMGVDDVKMLSKMTQYVQKKYNLSKENAFLTGMSNGGDICYLAALEGQKTFKALAPVAGLAFTWFYKKYAMTNPHPVPLFEIHGTEDRVSEWWGDPEGKGGWGPYLSVPMAVNDWVARNGCHIEKRDTIKSKDANSKHYIIRHFYSGGKGDNDVWLYEVVGVAFSFTVMSPYTTTGLPCRLLIVVSLSTTGLLSRKASHDHALRFTCCFTPLSRVKTRLSDTSCGSVSRLLAEVSSTNTRSESPFLSSRSFAWYPMVSLR